MTRGAAAMVAAALLGVLLLAGLGWHLTGGRWATIATGSMGRAAPVGTLVLTRPVRVTDLRVGDLVTYRPPARPGAAHSREGTLTHRVVAVHPGRTITVRGDVNGAPDPWPVHDRDLIGVVVARWWGAGWLLRALPYLLLGTIVLVAGTATYATPRWRSAARVLGTTALVSSTALILRPFVRTATIATTTTPSGRTTSLEATGLFPIRVTSGTHHLDLLPGQSGQLPIATITHGGRYLITSAAHLPLTWTLAVAAVSALPLAWCLTIGLSNPEPEPNPADAADETGTGSANIPATGPTTGPVSA